jgi:hypothetical protein
MNHSCTSATTHLATPFSEEKLPIKPNTWVTTRTRAYKILSLFISVNIFRHFLNTPSNKPRFLGSD